jgi:hypothetical protein
MESHKQKTERVFKIMEGWPKIEPAKKISNEEFVERRRRVWNAISKPRASLATG